MSGFSSSLGPALSEQENAADLKATTMSSYSLSLSAYLGAPSPFLSTGDADFSVRLPNLSFPSRFPATSFWAASSRSGLPGHCFFCRRSLPLGLLSAFDCSWSLCIRTTYRMRGFFAPSFISAYFRMQPGTCSYTGVSLLPIGLNAHLFLLFCLDAYIRAYS